MAGELAEVTRLKYQELARALAQANIGQGIVAESNVWQQINSGNLSPAEFNQLVTSKAGYNAGFRAVGNADGTIRSYTYVGSDYPMGEFTYDDIIGSFNSNVQSGTSAPSNTFTMQQPSNTALNGTAGAEKVGASGGVTKYTNGTASANPILTTMGSVVGAVMAAGTGIQLAKTIDGGLYHIGNALGLDPPEALNPETWNSITAGSDAPTAGLFNYIFGLNPDNGKLTAYADADAFAYMAGWLMKQGFFAPSEGGTVPDNPEGVEIPERYHLPFNAASGSYFYYKPLAQIERYDEYTFSNNVITAIFFSQPYQNNRWGYTVYFVSTQPATYSLADQTGGQSTGSLHERSYNGNTFYMYAISGTTQRGTSITDHSGNIPYNMVDGTSALRFESSVGYLLVSNYHQAQTLPGVDTQPNASVPDTSNWDYTDPHNTILPSLQQQYPDLWNNRLENDVVQPDGTVKKYVYLPTVIPDGGNGTNPDTQNNHQNTNPEVDPDNTSETTLQTIIQIITSLLPQAMTDPETVPEGKLQDGTNTKNPNPDIPNNPPDTGSGSSPIPILPTGSASSLWRVYHPSQATIDAFGAWLWSSNFVEQIKKMFNDPMSAIIGLHKIFATPIDAGTANIKVGYLDSGVASAYVDQQYVTVDCGSVKLDEYFGNVFDYDPYTKVAIYLPFIGVQGLNTAEVMRSTINVVYHVDIFTGACLAEVNVSRDGDSGCLYTFSGDCSARYPLSSGSYMGIVGGILSIAGGIAGTIASGGNMIPAVLGASSAMTHMHTDIKHSGQISGNAGAMGVKVPFLIVLRPQTAMANSYEHFTGRPANKFALIGQASGYIKCKEVHVDNLSGASDKEKEMVASLLKSGIIV